MSVIDSGLDPRLLRLAQETGNRSDAPVVVERGTVIVGTLPNCAIFSVSDDNEHVLVSFHLDAHPISTIHLTLLALSCFDREALVFINAFLCDETGVLVYEEEPGFDLVYIQYLRDSLRNRERKTKIFVA